jgi:hypothetical protein
LADLGATLVPDLLHVGRFERQLTALGDSLFALETIFSPLLTFLPLFRLFGYVTGRLHVLEPRYRWSPVAPAAGSVHALDPVRCILADVSHALHQG